MLFALGAASSAIDTLKRLISSNSLDPIDRSRPEHCKSVRHFRQRRDRDLGRSEYASAGGGCLANSPGDDGRAAGCAEPVFNRLDGVSAASRSAALKDLFWQIDADGDGKITKSEFENALGAGGTNLAQADDVFSKLDKNSDGSVSLNEMSSALKGGSGGHHRHHHVAGRRHQRQQWIEFRSADAGPDGATSTAVTNSDGIDTTTLTYADGSKVTMTSRRRRQSTSSAATSSYNFIEQMIQRQANAISTSATASLSVSA